MIGETKFRVKQYTQIMINIRWGEAVSQNVNREGIFEPLMIIQKEQKTINSGFNQDLI